MTTVFSKADDGSTRKLRQVRAKDEARELQNALELNPDLLPGEQINPDAPRRWLMVGREMPIPGPTAGTDRWSLDFVFVDQSAMLTFVECKRYEDTRARREVIGQMLEYAANAQFYWTGDLLQQCAENAAAMRDGTLAEAVTALHPDGDLATTELFVRAIQNLKEGNFRLVFFLDEAPRELKCLAHFLNQHLEVAEVLVVEATQYTDGQGVFVVPRLFGFTEEFRVAKERVRESRPNSSGRRKWDEQSFFDKAGTLPPEHLSVVRRVYDFVTKSECRADRVDWGTGASRGSFNPKYMSIFPRAVFTLYTDGQLQLDFGHINGSDEAEAFRDCLFGALRADGLLPLKDADLSEYPGFEVSLWAPKADQILRVLAGALQQHAELSDGGGSPAARKE